MIPILIMMILCCCSFSKALDSSVINKYYVDWECDGLDQPLYSHSKIVSFIRQYNYNLLKCNKNTSHASVNAKLMSTMYSRVSLPCTGTPFKDFPKLSYNMSQQCGLVELFGPYQFIRPIDTRALTIILNMPKKCTYYGIHTGKLVGINEMRLEDAQWASTLVHEMGHEWGLSHSTSLTYDYGDCSCIMGCASNTDVCFNAPQAERLGMLRALPDSDLRLIDGWKIYNLPLYESGFDSFVSIKGKECTLYLSIRSSKIEKGVAGLGSVNFDGEWVTFDDRLSVHLVDKKTDRTYFVDTIAPNGQIWDLVPRAAKINFTIPFVRFIKAKWDSTGNKMVVQVK